MPKSTMLVRDTLKPVISLRKDIRKMKNNRDIIIKFKVNEIENEMINKRFALSNAKSKSSFIRGLITNGVVVRFDEKKITDIYRAIVSVSNNVNQIAVRVNSTGNLYENDLEEIRKGINEILKKQRYLHGEFMKLRR